MKESDWKVFKKIKNRALERYCQRVLDEFQAVITNTDEHVHDRYLRLYDLVHKRNKEMAQMFDGHSRSRAWLQLVAIRSHALADEEMLAELTDEFREQTDLRWDERE